MGLDITAYRQLKKLYALYNEHGEPVNPVTSEPYDDYFKVYFNMYFPVQSEGLDDLCAYTYEDSMGFRAGSYGYTQVPFEKVEGYAPSTVMSAQIGAFDSPDGPFHELICYSDCEGCIGPVVAAKLAKDFEEWDEKAKTYAGTDSYFYQKYCCWKDAMIMAADGGAVAFH